MRKLNQDQVGSPGEPRLRTGGIGTRCNLLSNTDTKESKFLHSILIYILCGKTSQNDTIQICNTG